MSYTYRYSKSVFILLKNKFGKIYKMALFFLLVTCIQFNEIDTYLNSQT